MRSIIVLSLVSAAAAVVLGGCAAKSGPVQSPAPSTASGSVALSTFPSVPSNLTIRDEAGHVLQAALAADGAFSVALPKGHTYKVAVTTPKGDVPLVFPRSSGRFDTSFVLKSDGARVPLGTVRYLPRAPVGGFRVATLTAPPASGAGQDCVDCVNDDPKVTCEGEGDQSGADQGGQSDGTNAEKQTKAPEAAASGSDASDQADPTQEMAVGDQNAPEQVDGCGGEQDGANVEQAGEH